jgi:Zn-finger nucleic acid-binding protein
MRCPIDGTELRITDRQGVEIDYCPQCRGVWLDRGEMDKIIDRLYETPEATGRQNVPEVPSAPPGNTGSGQWVDPTQHQNAPRQNQPGQNQPGQSAGAGIVPAIGGLLAGMAASQMANRGHHGHSSHYGHPHKKRKKHKGWLDEMFDFD